MIIVFGVDRRLEPTSSSSSLSVQDVVEINKVFGVDPWRRQTLMTTTTKHGESTSRNGCAWGRQVPTTKRLYLLRLSGVANMMTTTATPIYELLRFFSCGRSEKSSQRQPRQSRNFYTSTASIADNTMTTTARFYESRVRFDDEDTC